jgi:hypothetical protein
MKELADRRKENKRIMKKTMGNRKRSEEKEEESREQVGKPSAKGLQTAGL